MLTVVIGKGVLGQPAPIGEAWATLRPQLLRLIGAALLVFLLTAGIFIVALLPGFLFAIGGGQGGAIALLVIGGIVGIIVLIYVAVLLALSTPALILERQPVIAALRRSRLLVRGAWWRTFGILLLSALIAGVVGGIIQLPFGLASSGGSLFDPNASASFTGLLIRAIGAIVAGTIVRPFSAGVTALLLRRPSHPPRGARRHPGRGRAPVAVTPTDPPIVIGGDDARRAAQAELTKRIYHAQDRPLLQRIMTAALHWLGHFLDRAAGASPGGGIGLVLIAVAVVAIVIAIRLGLGPLASRTRVAAPLFDKPWQDADDHRRAADAYAAAGDFAGAVRERLRAVVRELEQRGVLEPRAGRTADEAAAEAGRVLPHLDPALRSAARAFDDVWYGGRPATAATDEPIRALDQQVRAARIPTPA